MFFRNPPMMILSAKTFPAPNGCRIMRPKDRSCWILIKPNNKSSQFATKKDAIIAAEKIKS